MTTKQLNKKGIKPPPARKAKPLSTPPIVMLCEGIDLMQYNLTDRARRFVVEYFVDYVKIKAYIRAGYSDGPSDSGVYDLWRNHEIQRAVRDIQAKISSRVQYTADDWVAEQIAIARADPNELMEVTTVNCRYCWGEGFLYQMTPNEYKIRLDAYNRETRKMKPEDIQPFDGLGGPGFYGKKEPNPDCPECCGDGVSRVRAKDTTKLTPDALKLYNGAKVGRNGSVEINIASKEKSRELLGRHLGTLKERVFFENPLHVAPAQQVDAKTASEVHKQLLED